jgi:hypothetical protein
MSKPKRPTKRQQAMGELFKAGSTVTSIAAEFTGWPFDPDGRMKVEQAIRVCMAWGRRNG